MIKPLIRAGIRRFSKRYDYDTSYLEEMVGTDPGAVVKLTRAAGFLEHRFGLAADVCFAAKIRSTQLADCGPCTRLAVDMAVEAGVKRQTALAVAVEAKLPDDLELSCRYAEQVVAGDAGLPETIEEVRARFGERGLYGLATAVVAGQFYPLLKRGMGHASACEPVVAAFRQELGLNTVEDGNDDRTAA